MQRFALTAAFCLLASQPIMAADFGFVCEKKHGNGKYMMHVVSAGYEAFVVKDNLFRGHVSAGKPQSVTKIDSSSSTQLYQRAYWGGKDQYIVGSRGEYIRLESTNRAQRMNDKFDESCRRLTSQEIESILLRARQRPPTHSASPFGP